MLIAADIMDEQKLEKKDEEDFYDCHETLEANKQFTEEAINLQRLNLQTRERRTVEVSDGQLEGSEELEKTKDEQFKVWLKDDILDEGGIEGATVEDEGKRREGEEEVALFTTEKVGQTVEEAEFPSEQVQLDEEYLLELEKELSDEDKEVRLHNPLGPD